MCTLTWFARPGGYGLFFNRDELRTRGAAHPPLAGRRGEVRYLAPRDADFGGTWICVNDRGLTLCLLNGFAPADEIVPPGGHASRGELPPSLVGCESLADVGQALERRRLDRFRSFVLAGFSADGGTGAWDWRDGRLRGPTAIDPARPLVSSSFRSGEVCRSRVELFQRMRSQWNGAIEELHLAYHESHLPERGAHSPCMHRSDGKTVSFSCIAVDDREVRFRYVPHSPCAGRPEDAGLRLARRSAH